MRHEEVVAWPETATRACPVAARLEAMEAKMNLWLYVICGLALALAALYVWALCAMAAGRQ